MDYRGKYCDRCAEEIRIEQAPHRRELHSAWIQARKHPCAEPGCDRLVGPYKTYCLHHVRAGGRFIKRAADRLPTAETATETPAARQGGPGAEEATA